MDSLTDWPPLWQILNHDKYYIFHYRLKTTGINSVNVGRANIAVQSNRC